MDKTFKEVATYLYPLKEDRLRNGLRSTLRENANRYLREVGMPELGAGNWLDRRVAGWMQKHIGEKHYAYDPLSVIGLNKRTYVATRSREEDDRVKQYIYNKYKELNGQEPPDDMPHQAIASSVMAKLGIEKLIFVNVPVDEGNPKSVLSAMEITNWDPASREQLNEQVWRMINDPATDSKIRKKLTKEAIRRGYHEPRLSKSALVYGQGENSSQSSLNTSSGGSVRSISETRSAPSSPASSRRTTVAPGPAAPPLRIQVLPPPPIRRAEVVTPFPGGAPTGGPASPTAASSRRQALVAARSTEASKVGPYYGI